MTAPKKNINKYIKTAVWDKCCCPADNRVAQCATCEILVRYPEAIKDLFENNNYPIPYQINGVGEFGHIIAESEGGETTVENLMVQCKSCNVRLGTKTMNLYYKPDVVMLDEDIGDQIIDFTIETEICTFIKKDGQKCKKRSLTGNCYCQNHLS